MLPSWGMASPQQCEHIADPVMVVLTGDESLTNESEHMKTSWALRGV